ncbi:MAG TPA: ABC transporter permease [Chloroflexota bacterium]|nr:ABC transporter permease [Chloroflexota bacterium]
MRLDYVVRRVAIFFVITWLAATINFFLPHLTSQDPVKDKLLEASLQGGAVQSGIQEMAAEYNKKFGLDKPLWEQYVTYLGDVAHFDFNYSIANYPRTVTSLIFEALPWTIGLLSVALGMSFAIGTALGALAGWPRAPGFIKVLMPPLFTLHSIPFFLLGLILIYVFGYVLQVVPMFGGYTPGAFPTLSMPFILDVLHHAILPALSIILVDIGGWALGMRGMMVTTQGEDYAVFAEAKGLKGSTIFMRYAVRNAILPQTTGLAIAFGRLVSGAVLVEVIFAFPGIGNTLYQAIRAADYFLIEGIVFCAIVTLGLSLLVLDILYPLIDPRITYRRT